VTIRGIENNPQLKYLKMEYGIETVGDISKSNFKHLHKASIIINKKNYT
jgi:hypothetical protein